MDEIYLEQEEYIFLLMQKKAVERVRELHKEHIFTGLGGTYVECRCCERDYPCATIKALDGEQE
jgi:hypothetical protein